MKRALVLTISACLLWVGRAQAEEAAPEEPALQEARELVTRYLKLVQTKKWAEAKKVLHPDTLKSIAERKKRLGKEDHPMAPWFHDKTSYYLKAFKITGVREAIGGTVVVETSEDNFQVEERGVAEGELATYLVGKRAGKLYVVDKKRGETFNDDSIRIGYKNYFDKPKAEAPAEEP